MQEKELGARRLIKMELFENGKSLIYALGYNITNFTNVILKPTKSEEV